MIDQGFLTQFGYVAVFIGALIEGEAVVLTASALAAQGFINFPFVLLVALAGAITGDHIFFILGRYGGFSFFCSRPVLVSRIGKLSSMVTKHRLPIAVLFRFLYGCRLIVPTMLGSTPMTIRTFSVCNILGASFWVLTYGLTGYGLVSAISRENAARGGLFLSVIAALTILALLFNARKTERKQQSLTINNQLPHTTH
jgi:membrane protein DedA with SNARE-associated domain